MINLSHANLLCCEQHVSVGVHTSDQVGDLGNVVADSKGVHVLFIQSRSKRVSHVHKLLICCINKSFHHTTNPDL